MATATGRRNHPMRIHREKLIALLLPMLPELARVDETKWGNLTFGSAGKAQSKREEHLTGEILAAMDHGYEFGHMAFKSPDFQFPGIFLAM
jgi:hypothetical protein